MALQPPKAEGVVKFLIVGMVLLFLISNIINLNAFGKGDCSNPVYTTKDTCEAASATWTSAEIYREGKCTIGTTVHPEYDTKAACTAPGVGGKWSGVDYNDLIPQVYKWLIVGMAAWLAWLFTVGGGITGRLNRKTFINLVIMAVVLYFVYNKVIVGLGLIPGLNPIEFAAYQLQSIIAP